jgi:hypothetical protein
MKKFLLQLFLIILPLCTIFGLPMPNGDDLFVANVQTDKDGNVISVMLDASYSQDVTTPIGVINAWMNLTFYPNGSVKKVQPRDTHASVEIKTSQGTFFIEGPYEFYENGELALGSLVEPTQVDLSIGTVKIYSTIGFHPNKIVKSASLYGEPPKPSGRGSLFDAATPRDDFVITTKKGDKISVQEWVGFHDDGSLQSVRLSQRTPFTFGGQRFLGDIVEFYKSGSVHKIDTKSTTTLLLNSKYVNVKGPFEYYENGNILSFNLNQRLSMETSLGAFQVFERIWLYESGALKKMEMPASTRSEVLKANLDDSLSFYEDGAIKEMIFYRSYSGLLPFAAKRYIFYPDFMLKVVEYAGRGEMIDDLRVDRGDLLYFSAEGLLLGKAKWDDETEDYVLIE